MSASWRGLKLGRGYPRVAGCSRNHHPSTHPLTPSHNIRPPSPSASSASRFSTDAASHPSNRVQIHLSRSTDALLNLSVEHRLLQITPPDSTVLTLYVNGPSIVFGRNQNPWLQVNLNRLAQIAQKKKKKNTSAAAATGWNDAASDPVGASKFDRNKHAEMVVRALKALSRPNTRVNERHDIVMDVASSSSSSSTEKAGNRAEVLCGTSNVDNDEFKDAVVREFESMYGEVHLRDEFDDDAALQVEETPRFTFSTHPTQEDPRPRAELPFDVRFLFSYI
ncbi:hypothetical protein MKX07_008828 [Trichoderma sp. CBMAI-0711]|nr:hypothetical protein MKX07_008828 [Trichoderma sp. CBMAI-0711]